MSDGCESTDGMALAMDMAHELHKLQPDHELLALFPPKGTSKRKHDTIWEQFQTRFGRAGITKEQRAAEPGQAYFWAQYFLALKKEVETLKQSRATAQA